MKRFLSLALAAMLLITACSCSGGGGNASDKAVSVASQAIEIADQYLDGDIDAGEADEKLDDLIEQMSYVDDLPDETAEESRQRAADFLISTDLTVLSYSIFNDNYEQTSDSYDEVVENRNELASDAGLKER